MANEALSWDSFSHFDDWYERENAIKIAFDRWNISPPHTSIEVLPFALVAAITWTTFQTMQQLLWRK